MFVSIIIYDKYNINIGNWNTVVIYIITLKQSLLNEICYYGSLLSIIPKKNSKAIIKIIIIIVHIEIAKINALKSITDSKV